MARGARDLLVFKQKKKIVNGNDRSIVANFKLQVPWFI
jgi:hypothetical protein